MLSILKNGNVRLGLSKELMKKVPDPKKLLTFNIPNIFKIKKILHSRDTYYSNVGGKSFKIKYIYQEKRKY